MTVEHATHPARATLVLSYAEDWPLPDRADGTPDLIGELQARAVADLLQKNKTDFAVFDSRNRQADKSQTMVAESMAHQTELELGSTCPDPRLIVTPKETNTRGEVASFGKLARQNNWGDLEVLVFSPHRKRAERAVERMLGKKIAQKVKITSTEDLLEPHVVASIQQHPYYQGIVRREKMLNIIDTLPFGGVLFELIDKIPGMKRLEAASNGLFGKVRSFHQTTK